MDRHVTDDNLDNALELLRSTSDGHADAKAAMVRAEYWLRHVEALEMKRHSLLPLEGQRREARASAAYVKAIDALTNAVRAHAVFEAEREAAVIQIELWRTEEANKRAHKPI